MGADFSGIGAVADLANSVIDKIWPDTSEQDRQKMVAAMAMIQGQIEVNKVEAGSGDRFVSGWRPFIGWVCGAACAWNWIGLSIVKMILEITQQPISIAPASLTEMLPVLIGMLGLGAYRTAEKIKGVS
jgi:hypothetical protein